MQAVVEKQSFLRKMFGYTSIHFTITSDMDDFDKDDVTLNGNVTVLDNHSTASLVEQTEISY